MNKKSLKTLEDIAQEVGLKQFSQWKKEAEAEWENSEYGHTSPDAHHTYVNDSIFSKYDTYINNFREKGWQGE